VDAGLSFGYSFIWQLTFPCWWSFPEPYAGLRLPSRSPFWPLHARLILAQPSGIDIAPWSRCGITFCPSYDRDNLAALPFHHPRHGPAKHRICESRLAATSSSILLDAEPASQAIPYLFRSNYCYSHGGAALRRLAIQLHIPSCFPWAFNPSKCPSHNPPSTSPPHHTSPATSRTLPPTHTLLDLYTLQPQAVSVVLLHISAQHSVHVAGSRHSGRQFCLCL